MSEKVEEKVEGLKKFEVELAEPEIIKGKEVSKLEFREPKGEDMEDFLGETTGLDGSVNIGGAITGLVSRCAVSHMLSVDTLRAFSARNYMKIAKEFMGFIR